MPTDNSSNRNSSSGSRASTGSIILFALLIGSVIWLSFYVVAKYQQLKLYRQANQALQQQGYRQAVLAYDRLRQTSLKDDARFWLARSYALKGLGQYQDMLQSCNRVTTLAPQEAKGWNCQGEALYELEQYAAAANAFDKAVSLAPQTVTLWLNKSEALLKAKYYLAADKANQRAINLLQTNANFLTEADRQLAVAYNLQGEILLARQLELEALLAFERSLTINPNYLKARQNKGIALYELKHYPLADVVWQEILQQPLPPEQEAIVRLYRGITFCATQNRTAAEQNFTQVLELSRGRQIREMAEAGCGIQ